MNEQKEEEIILLQFPNTLQSNFNIELETEPIYEKTISLFSQFKPLQSTFNIEEELKEENKKENKELREEEEIKEEINKTKDIKEYIGIGVGLTLFLIGSNFIQMIVSTSYVQNGIKRNTIIQRLLQNLYKNYDLTTFHFKFFDLNKKIQHLFNDPPIQRINRSPLNLLLHKYRRYVERHTLSIKIFVLLFCLICCFITFVNVYLLIQQRTNFRTSYIPNLIISGLLVSVLYLIGIVSSYCIEILLILLNAINFILFNRIIFISNLFLSFGIILFAIFEFLSEVPSHFKISEIFYWSIFFSIFFMLFFFFCILYCIYICITSCNHSSCFNSKNKKERKDEEIIEIEMEEESHEQEIKPEEKKKETIGYSHCKSIFCINKWVTILYGSILLITLFGSLFCWKETINSIDSVIIPDSFDTIQNQNVTKIINIPTITREFETIIFGCGNKHYHKEMYRTPTIKTPSLDMSTYFELSISSQDYYYLESNRIPLNGKIMIPKDLLQNSSNKKYSQQKYNITFIIPTELTNLELSENGYRYLEETFAQNDIIPIILDTSFLDKDSKGISFTDKQKMKSIEEAYIYYKTLIYYNCIHYLIDELPKHNLIQFNLNSFGIVGDRIGGTIGLELIKLCNNNITLPLLHPLIKYHSIQIESFGAIACQTIVPDGILNSIKSYFIELISSIPTYSNPFLSSYPEFNFTRIEYDYNDGIESVSIENNESYDISSSYVQENEEESKENEYSLKQYMILNKTTLIHHYSGDLIIQRGNENDINTEYKEPEIGIIINKIFPKSSQFITQKELNYIISLFLGSHFICSLNDNCINYNLLRDFKLADEVLPSSGYFNTFMSSNDSAIDYNGKLLNDVTFTSNASFIGYFYQNAYQRVQRNLKCFSTCFVQYTFLEPIDIHGIKFNFFQVEKSDTFNSKILIQLNSISELLAQFKYVGLPQNNDVPFKLGRLHYLQTFEFDCNKNGFPKTIDSFQIIFEGEVLIDNVSVF